jgi:hypothetical protein
MHDYLFSAVLNQFTLYRRVNVGEDRAGFLKQGVCCAENEVSDLEASFAAPDFYSKPRAEIFDFETQLKSRAPLRAISDQKKAGSFLIPLRKLTEGTVKLSVLSDSRALTTV